MELCDKYGKGQVPILQRLQMAKVQIEKGIVMLWCRVMMVGVKLKAVEAGSTWFSGYLGRLAATDRKP